MAEPAPALRLQGLGKTYAGAARPALQGIDLLLPAVERLQQHWPNIRVDLEVSTQLLSLGRRQADATSF